MNDDNKIYFRLQRQMYEGKDNFKILSVKLTRMNNEVKLHPIYGTVSIKGNIPIPINKTNEYVCTIVEEESHPKYGTSYKVANCILAELAEATIDTDKDFLKFIKVSMSEGIANKLSKYGKGILNIVKEGNVDEMMKIKGIGSATANKIVSTFKHMGGNKAHIDIIDYGFSEKEVEIIEKAFDSPEEALAVLKSNPYSIIYKSNIKLARLDKMVLNNGGNKYSRERIKAFIYYAIQKEVGVNVSFIELSDFYELEIIANLVDNIGKEKIELAIEELEHRDILKSFFDKDGNKYITTERQWNIELLVAKRLMSLSRVNPIHSFNKNVDLDKLILDKEKEMGVELNKEQKEAVKGILTNSVVEIIGSAGTGKTFCVSIALDILEEQFNDFKCRGCALSGKAAQVLASSSNRESSTIHKLLGLKGEDGELNDKMKLDYDVIILDEASMCNYDILQKLLKSLEEGNRLVILGDDAQLSSIGTSDTIRDVADVDTILVIRLIQVMRQKGKSGILEVATDIRNGVTPMSIRDGRKVFGELQDMEIIIDDNCYNDTIKEFINNYEDYKDNPTDIAVLSPTKKMCFKLNNDIQSELVKKGYLNTKKKAELPKFNNESNIVYEGTVVMVIKNNYEVGVAKYLSNNSNISQEEYIDGLIEELQIQCDRECTQANSDIERELIMEKYAIKISDIKSESTTNIFNGNVGVIKEIKKDYMIISILDEDVIFTEDMYDSLLKGYAYSIHKSQGSSIPCTIGYLENSYVVNSMLGSRNLLYTLVSRGKVKCKLYLESFTTLKMCINREETTDKKTITGLYINSQIK